MCFVVYWTYSHDVIVRAHIHSERSNILTMESYPPDARYLWCSLLSLTTHQRQKSLPPARIQCHCYTSPYMSRRAFTYRERRIIHNTDSVLLMVCHNDTISDMIKHCRGGHNMLSHWLSVKAPYRGKNAYSVFF
jgi:hypothetical protein